MSRYMPVYFYPDRMPIDISWVFPDERPSGKHGFCRVDGDQFSFEDGTPAKFWGVIFNGATCFPDHDYAEGVARRLAQAGCNIVRFHQMDAEWANPNIFRYRTGRPLFNTRSLDPESMERHDYLIKCLKDQGIYICCDVTTYRKFKTGDGVRDADLLADNMKNVALYAPEMIQLQKEYASQYFNHVNPYTGLAYKDDPSFVLVAITNENDMFIQFKGHKQYGQRSKYYDDMLRDMFDKWLKEKGIDYDAYGCELFTKDQPMVDFRVEVGQRFYEEMRRYLKEDIGLKIPITGTNWSGCSGMIKSQENMDYMEGHKYYYDWRWGEYEKITFNQSITQIRYSPMKECACTRIHGKPFFITEWDMPWPNAYRAEAPIWYPAIACLQGWSGMCIHTYSYGTNLSHLDVLGKESSSNTIGSVPYREGIFTCWNDPSKFGLFYHGALMVRRGDVKQANKTVGAQITNYGKSPNGYTENITAWGMEHHRIDAVLDSCDTSDLEDIRPIEQNFDREDPDMIVSDTGELWRNVKKRIGAVDSPRTKAVYGFMGNTTWSRPESDVIQLRGMTVQCNTDFATIALSSLTDDPIEESPAMLLSTIGRSSSRGSRFDGEKLLDFGTGPTEVEIIDAVIRIKTNVPGLRIWSVNSDGYYIGMLDKTYEDGWIKFHVGPNYPGMYYLITKE